MSVAPVVARLRDGAPVGAWLLKANPAVWDVGAFLASGAQVDSWRLAPSYRCELMAPGQPAVLWVTRGDPAYESGVWAVGRVTGHPIADAGDPDDELWRDQGARHQVRPFVELRMDVLARAVPVADCRDDPVLSTMELFRAPRMGSPVALSPPEWDALRGLLPPALAGAD